MADIIGVDLDAFVAFCRDMRVRPGSPLYYRILRDHVNQSIDIALGLRPGLVSKRRE